jgi:hypothetical protein
LVDARVPGNVTVQPGGSLTVGQSIIGGNVTSTDAGDGPGSYSVVICGSRVDGNVTITGSVGQVVVGGPLCGGNQIGGNVTLTGNHANVYLDYNAQPPLTQNCGRGGGQASASQVPNLKCGIGGNVTVSNNKRPEVTFNKIYGNLTCRDNVCGIVEHDNIVLGVRRGQCVGGS